MPSADSRSDSDLDVKELALRIALERSNVDTGGSFGSATSHLPHQRSADARVGPFDPHAAPRGLHSPRHSHAVTCPCLCPTHRPGRARRNSRHAPLAVSGSRQGRGTRQSNRCATTTCCRRSPMRTGVSSLGSPVGLLQRRRRTLGTMPEERQGAPACH